MGSGHYLALSTNSEKDFEKSVPFGKIFTGRYIKARKRLFPRQV